MQTQRSTTGTCKSRIRSSVELGTREPGLCTKNKIIILKNESKHVQGFGFTIDKQTFTFMQTTV